MLVHFTKLGRAMRATAENPTVAGLMGVNINRIISATFIIGSALAAVAGILVSTNYGIAHYYMGFVLGLKAFSLDNMYSDSSLVRETVTMKMFEKMKLPASREAHARVYVNNEYVGAYVLIATEDRKLKMWQPPAAHRAHLEVILLRFQR
jgi:hypothetical protein